MPSVARDRAPVSFKTGFDVLYADEQTTHHYANVYRQLRKQGTPIPTDDMWIAADSGSFVSFNIKENPRLDYGYAVTSHSSQGQTAKRLPVNEAIKQAGEKLVNGG